MAHVCLHKVSLASSAAAVAITLALILGWYGFPYIVNKNVAQRISLLPGSEAMQRWMNIPFPLEFKVYFFNVTNAEKIQMGEKPKVEEVGPYVFDLYKTQVNVTYDKVNDTVEYFTKNKYYFNKKKSYPNRENDILVLINLPLMGTASMVERMFPVGLSFLDKAIPYLFPNISSMFLTATAKQFMFDGVLINCSYPVGPAMPVCNGMRGRLPPTVVTVPDSKNFKFSFFKHKNDSLDGPFKIHAGNQNIHNIGQIIEYKTTNNLSMWQENTTCNLLRGTDSTIFAPVVNVDDDLYIYVPDICLSLAATYSNKTSINGITTYRYIGDDSNFADGISEPGNLCRCTKSDANEPPTCLKRGAIEATNCQGVPVIFTQPHFLDADPEYTKYPEGLNPDLDKHLTFVMIEPYTGVPVVGRKRMQMNIFLRRIEDITLLTNVSEGLFPIAWVEEGGEINEESMQKLADFYYTLHCLDVAKWIITVFGVTFLIAAVIIYVKYRSVFCSNGNQVSEFSYGINAFHIDKKVSTDRTKSSIFCSPNGSNDVIPTVSNNLENKTNSNNDIQS